MNSGTDGRYAAITDTHSSDTSRRSTGVRRLSSSDVCIEGAPLRRSSFWKGVTKSGRDAIQPLTATSSPPCVPRLCGNGQQPLRLEQVCCERRLVWQRGTAAPARAAAAHAAPAAAAAAPYAPRLACFGATCLGRRRLARRRHAAPRRLRRLPGAASCPAVMRRPCASGVAHCRTSLRARSSSRRARRRRCGSFRGRRRRLERVPLRQLHKPELGHVGGALGHLGRVEGGAGGA